MVYNNNLILTGVFVKQESIFESVLAAFRDKYGKNDSRAGVFNDKN